MRTTTATTTTTTTRGKTKVNINEDEFKGQTPGIRNWRRKRQYDGSFTKSTISISALFFCDCLTTAASWITLTNDGRGQQERPTDGLTFVLFLVIGFVTAAVVSAAAEAAAQNGRERRFAFAQSPGHDAEKPKEEDARDDGANQLRGLRKLIATKLKCWSFNVLLLSATNQVNVR